MGVGGCSSFDVVHILRKARQDVTSCRCEMEAERAENEIPPFLPKFTCISGSVAITSRKIRETGMELSAEKYYSAAIMPHAVAWK